MIVIENEKLIAGISLHGAELSRLFLKDAQQEVLWNADGKYWARHAPVLFPNVGKYFKGALTHKGMDYPEGQHGFARDCEFVCTIQESDRAVFILESNEDTLKRYPFPFRLEIGYELEDAGIKVMWKVLNIGNETMYFTIGGHPAFNVPVLDGTKFTDYYLYFEGKDSLDYKLLDKASGCIIADSREVLPLENSMYQLREGMFDNDALVFDDGQIDKVAILYPDKKPYITMECAGFPNFGIWSKPGAPFVCLEPWQGRTDNAGFEGEISTKPGITALNPGEVFNKSHEIIVG